MSAPSARAGTAAAIREHMVDALHADLIGPNDPDHAEEILPRTPSRWYLTGFLAPEARRVAMVNEDENPVEEDVESQEELAAGRDDAKTEPEEPKAKKRMLWPASIGLSVLLPAETNTVTATVEWADYLPLEEEAPGGDRPGKAPHPATRSWRRVPRPPITVGVTLRGARGRQKLAGSEGLELEYQLVTAEAPGLAAGTRALSLFLVNRRTPVDGPDADKALTFQVSLLVVGDPTSGLVPRPNHRGERSDDEDDRTADLQYRKHQEWAVGHGVSVAPHLVGDRVVGASSVWMPRATVPLVQTIESMGPDVVLGMDALAALADGPAVRAGLMGVANQYGRWIDQEVKKIETLTGPRRGAAQQLVAKAKRARDRIVEGIEILATDREVREAFGLANQAMADQARRRQTSADGKSPSWRPFQLAFLLLSLPGIADDHHDDREVVELIFFPTGGGKTEAYLGLAAIILVLRRLRGAARPDGGLGVAVLLRYTLRLLTLDQLGRAATLICALELLRRKNPERLGGVRFSLGLWVGQKATPNSVKTMDELLQEYRDSPTDSVPCPLTACPWCGKALGMDSLDVRLKDARFPEVRVGCISTDRHCPFTLAEPGAEGLPVIFVDEQLYRELPGFIIATVDKLAMLPFRGETAALFGRVVARDGRTFIGLMDKASDAVRGVALPDGLRPPDLIIQDELHLISGPLGTMVGLYEMAVDGLCARTGPDGHCVRPKVVASTATVRRARQQITALFGRVCEPAMFPPAGIDAGSSFFGAQDTAGPGRLYLGVAAPGRATKAVLLAVYVALLTAAQRVFNQGPEGKELADAYMTLVGYFNSLRELGGMRRLVEDEVRNRCGKDRSPQPGANRWFAIRHLNREPLELTSRESTQRITEGKRLLEQPHTGGEAVDVVLASNMISVGVDVQRLGLMVVAGQPKTTSEYIQSTSRVGRDRNRPGLVVVAFNVYRPRDRSHYEHFEAYHEAFHANVEATSVTPFSAPALERGLAGALVALTRLGDPGLIPPNGAAALAQHTARRDHVLDLIAERAACCGAIDASSKDAEARGRTVRDRAQALFDSWDRIVARAKDGEQARVYSTFDVGCNKRPSLLLTPIIGGRESLDSDERRFVAPLSMRDVEAPVPLWVVRRSLGRAEGGNGTDQK